MSQKVSLVFSLTVLMMVFLSACVVTPQAPGTTVTPATVSQKQVVNATPAVQPTETEAIVIPTVEVWHLLLLGDSSLGGIDEAYPAMIEQDNGVKVEVENYSLGGLAMNEVISYLQTGTVLRPDIVGLTDAIREAEVVVMFIGNPAGSIKPDDPFNMDGCLFEIAPPKNCSPSALELYTADLKTIWVEIFKLRNGQPTILRTMDLYTPRINEYKETGLLGACTRCFENYSEAIRLAAEAYHIPFVSRYDLYNGINHDEDPIEKGYIYSDGDHPSTLGGQVISEALARLGYEPVMPP